MGYDPMVKKSRNLMPVDTMVVSLPEKEIAWSVK